MVMVNNDIYIEEDNDNIVFGFDLAFFGPLELLVFRWFNARLVSLTPTLITCNISKFTVKSVGASFNSSSSFLKVVGWCNDDLL